MSDLVDWFSWSNKHTSPIYYPFKMNTAPQQVTERYLSNLLHYGRNKEFDIASIDRLEHIVQGTLVGYFWEVRVTPSNSKEGYTGHGATIAQSLRRSLEKHGVTFR